MSFKQTDFLTFMPPKKPNWHVGAPEGVRTDIAGTKSPLYPLAALALRIGMRNIVLQQPRTTCLYQAQSDQEADIYEQRSRIFGFKDLIQVWGLQQSNDPPYSGLVIYSQALTGYYDLGVNKRRVRRWLSELAGALE